MSRAKKRTPQVEEVRPYVEGVAKNLIDKLYGPDGPAWGTKLTEIEDLFVALREVLSEKLLAEALTRQATAHSHSPTMSPRNTPPPIPMTTQPPSRPATRRVIPHHDVARVRRGAGRWCCKGVWDGRGGVTVATV